MTNAPRQPFDPVSICTSDFSPTKREAQKGQPQKNRDVYLPFSITTNKPLDSIKAL